MSVVAIATHSFRVFGLSSPAWRGAKSFHDPEGSFNGHRQGIEGQRVVENRDEDDARQQIQQAIETALAWDAGGFGSVGGHRHRIVNLHRLSNINHKIVYGADLILEGDESIGDNHDGDGGGNHDKGYNNKHDPFQIQIIVSSASTSIPKKKLWDKLYTHGKRGVLGRTNEENLEELHDLNEEELQTILLHEDGDTIFNTDLEDMTQLGYHVDILLYHPHHCIPMENDDGKDTTNKGEERMMVLSPPQELNKMLPTYRPLTLDNSPTSNTNRHATRSNLHQTVYTLPQFTQPTSKEEEDNLKAFRLIVLDLQKGLVRIEFPKFREGCGEKTFREVYQLNAKLKSGSFATVCRGTHRATGEKVAVKCVLREDLPPNDDAAIYNEVLILATLKHPLICPLIDFFEEKECYFLVMELMAGGDLFDRIGKRKNYNERDAMILCKKMMESVCFCHENSVAHRDMKPKNLLVDENDDCAIKLADFGFAARVYEPCSLTKQCGTPFFIAPEVLMRQRYDERADMWSVGVITYLLLSGDLPFTGRSQKELFQNIVRGDFGFPEESWANISNEAKDLLRKLLVTDPSQRLTSKEAMRSRWFVKRTDRLSRTSLLHASVRLKTFNARMKLKSAMIAVRAISSAQLNTRSKSLAEIMPLEDDGEGSSNDEEEVDVDR